MAFRTFFFSSPPPHVITTWEGLQVSIFIGIPVFPPAHQGSSMNKQTHFFLPTTYIKQKRNISSWSSTEGKKNNVFSLSFWKKINGTSLEDALDAKIPIWRRNLPVLWDFRPLREGCKCLHKDWVPFPWPAAQCLNCLVACFEVPNFQCPSWEALIYHRERIPYCRLDV